MCTDPKTSIGYSSSFHESSGVTPHYPIVGPGGAAGDRSAPVPLHTRRPSSSNMRSRQCAPALLLWTAALFVLAGIAAAQEAAAEDALARGTVAQLGFGSVRGCTLLYSRALPCTPSLLKPGSLFDLAGGAPGTWVLRLRWRPVAKRRHSCHRPGDQPFCSRKAQRLRHVPGSPVHRPGEHQIQPSGVCPARHPARACSSRRGGGASE